MKKASEKGSRYLAVDGNPNASTVRVLVVDDFEPFRQFVCSMLRRTPELQFIGEASDGLDAVQKAEELQPDLILLDIGLPGQNGIEAAKQIRKLAPESKIIFVSQESSRDIVQEAFRVGALGYVLKIRARRDLLAAVQASICERRFVSNALSDYDFHSSVNEDPEGVQYT